MSYALRATLALLLFAGQATASLAQGSTTPSTVPSLEGRRIAGLIFESMDRSSSGVIHSGDVEQFRSSILVGMDADSDRKVTYGEVATWDPGFITVAKQVGRQEAYTTASRIVFAFWDRNGDGNLTEKEMRVSIVSDFGRADTDDDAHQTRDEFTSDFPILIAMRAPIRPDL